MQHNTVTSNVIKRIFHISVGTETGTAFVVDSEKGLFLATAKHMFKNVGYPQQIIIGIQHEHQWKSESVEVFYPSNSEIDVAVIKTNSLATRQFPEVEFKSAGLIISQNVFMLGFPYGIATNAYSVNDGYPMPIVKQGIFSGTVQTETTKKYLIDWDNNHGFSGGPVVFRKYEEGGLSKTEYIAGVIHGYCPHKIKIYNEDGSDTGLFTMENSGLGIMYRIEDVLEVIKQI